MPWYMRKPVLASVQGHALGAGCELAMFCDLTIAADDAMFGEPEARYSQAGPGFVMPWIIGFKKARELLYLGDMIDAPTALALGMVNRVVPRDDLSEDTLKFAQRMALPRGACHHQARDQSRCRRRRLSQRDAGRHRRGRAALCRTDRGRNTVPRARPQGRIGRRVEMAQGSVRNVIAKDWLPAASKQRARLPSSRAPEM
jgi:enoyl-CoA hydratase/carnithine racemase